MHPSLLVLSWSCLRMFLPRAACFDPVGRSALLSDPMAFGVECPVSSVSGCHRRIRPLVVGVIGSIWTIVIALIVEAKVVVIGCVITVVCASGCGIGAPSAGSGICVAVATDLTGGDRMTARFSGTAVRFCGADVVVSPVSLGGGRMTFSPVSLWL